MVELISRISKGTAMDQIYLPKSRIGFPTGTYVAVRPLDAKEEEIKPFFYNIQQIEPIKISIIGQIFKIITDYIESENIIITGSFLETGFKFNDIDILIIGEKKIDLSAIKEILENNLGIKFHLILITNKVLIKGISTDPLYRLMLSRCISRKRFIYKIKPKINYRILDLHLLKSKLLIENFDFLNGDEKYEMIRNAVSIALFVENKELTKRKVDDEIDTLFGKNTADKIKDNMIGNKQHFLDKYKRFYDALSSKILDRVKNASKQE